MKKKYKIKNINHVIYKDLFYHTNFSSLFFIPGETHGNFYKDYLFMVFILKENKLKDIQNLFFQHIKYEQNIVNENKIEFSINYMIYSINNSEDDELYSIFKQDKRKKLIPY